MSVTGWIFIWTFLKNPEMRWDAQFSPPIHNFFSLYIANVLSFPLLNPGQHELPKLFPLNTGFLGINFQALKRQNNLTVLCTDWKIRDSSDMGKQKWAPSTPPAGWVLSWGSSFAWDLQRSILAVVWQMVYFICRLTCLSCYRFVRTYVHFYVL